MSRRVSRDAVISFVEEMRTSIAVLRSCLESLRSDSQSSQNDALTESFRLIHSLKGTAALLCLCPTSEIAALFESFLEDALEAGESLGHEQCDVVDTYLALLERNAQRLAPGTDGEDAPADVHAELSEAVRLIRRMRSLPEEGDLAAIDEIVDRVAASEADDADDDETLDEDRLGGGCRIAGSDQSNFDVDLLEMDQLDAFIAEADEHLQRVAMALTDYSKAPENAEPLAEVRRRIHSLKGAASTSGFHEIAHLSHRLEDLLQRRISGELGATADVTELAQSTVDLLEELTQGLTGPEACLSLYEKYDALLGTAQTETVNDDAGSVATSGLAGGNPVKAIGARATTVADILAEFRPSTEQLLELEQDILGRTKISAELMEVFQEEAEDHLRSMYGCFTQLEKELRDRALIQSVRRSAHTLKGAAGAVGLKVVTQLAHRMEDLLDRLYEGGVDLNKTLLTLLYSTTDALQDLAHGDFEQQTMHATVADLYAEYSWRLNETDRVRVDSLEAVAQAAADALAAEMEAERERAAEHAAAAKLSASPASNDASIDATQQASTATVEAVDFEQTIELDAVAPDVLLLNDESDSNEQLEGVATLAGSAADAENSTVDVATLEVACDSEIIVDVPGFTVAPLKVGGANSSSPAAGTATGKARPASKSSRAVARDESQTGQVLRVPVQRLDALTRLVGELIINRTAFEQRMTDFCQFVEEMQLSIERLRNVAGQLESRYSVDLLGGRKSVAGDGASLAVMRSRLEEFDDLEFDRYTEFHLLAQSLAESSSDLNTVGGELRNLIGDFDQLLTRQGRLSRDTQDRLMRIRMVPLATLATRLHRTVRVVANQQNKQIDLEISGEYVELDKFVLEEMADPLLHLLRNAADHGIENAADRLASDKPERGTIRVEAFYQGTQVVVQISDDGRGLDIPRIRAKAVENGLVTQQEVDELSDEAVSAFVFQAGFSTAREISEVSGRGVGMDIVREKVSSLKGTVSIESEAGQGTTFTVRLPMTLAVTRALMVASRQATFAIPMQAVVQILRVERSEIERVGTQPIVRVGGRACPLVDLADRLHLRGLADDTLSAVPVLIIDAGGKQIALTVEKILTGRDIVVKTLGNHLRSVDGLIGATLMGDGSVVPILDVAWLVGSSATALRKSSAAAVPKKSRRSSSDSCTVMVVDDSVSVRRVMTNLLRSVGWHVLEARDGVDALEVLQGASRQPDIFLLDIEMPRMDGYELLSSLRSHDAFRTTPVVMVTSRAGDKHRQKAMNLGATDYLIKPYQDEQLLGLVRQLVDEPQAVGAGS